jgi:hypothetical protein
MGQIAAPKGGPASFGFAGIYKAVTKLDDAGNWHFVRVPFRRACQWWAVFAGGVLCALGGGAAVTGAT